jgi:hypothetical protein
MIRSRGLGTGSTTGRVVGPVDDVEGLPSYRQLTTAMAVLMGIPTLTAYCGPTWLLVAEAVSLLALRPSMTAEGSRSRQVVNVQEMSRPVLSPTRRAA